jgi:hypothetical protein
MALDFQLVSIAFTQGMDTRSDKKLVIPQKWNLLQNCNLSDSGALQKRDGVVEMLASVTGNGLATFNDQLLAFNGSVAKSITAPTALATNTTAAAVTGQLGFIEARAQQIDRASDFPEGMDVAYGLGFTAYTWASYTGAGVYQGTYLEVLDEATGARVIQKTLLNALGVRPRVVFSINAFFVFYISPAAGTLNCRVVTATSGVLALGAEVALITSASLVNENFDACEFMQSAAGSVAVSYQWSAVDSVRAIRVVQAAGVPSIATGPVALITQAEIPSASMDGLGVCRNTQGDYFATFVFARAGGATSGTVVKILDNTFASGAAYLQVDATVAVTPGACHVVATENPSANQCVVFTDQQSSIAIAASVRVLRKTVVDFTAGVITVFSSATLINSATGLTAGGTTLAPPRGPFIVGKPFSSVQWEFGAGIITGRLVLPVAIIEGYAATATNTTNLQPTIFILDAATGAVVSKALYGNYGVGQVLSVPIVYAASSTPVVAIRDNINYDSWALAVGQRGTLQFSSGVNTTQNGVTRLTFLPQGLVPPIRTQLESNTFISGGSLTAFDGIALTEVGFPLFPEGIIAAVSAGGAVPAGTYQAVVVYEWVDGAGQRHQSSPSLPVTFTTTGGNQTVTVTAPTLLLSQKAGITVVLYVTQDAGTIFNRVTPMTAPIANTTAAVSVTFPALAGATSITGVAGSELLYTQPLQSGTTLPNDAPGPTSCLAVHQNRIFVDATDTRGGYRYSQQVVPGFGLQWNASLGGTTPVDGGNIVGFSSLDEKVLIFCERKIYVVVGTGPTPSGGFDNYSEPIEIPSDTGCDSPRSILKMPNGVVFRSNKGWHRVGRDLVVQYIGDAMAAYDIYDVFSACYVEDRKEARFSCGFSFHYGTGNEIGVTLVYSYLSDQWSTSIIRVAPPAASERTLLAYDAMWWPVLGVYVSISLADGLCRDTPGVFVDALPTGVSAAVIMTARTSFLHLPQLEGFQRVRWLYLTGSFNGAVPAASGVSIVVDYDDVYSAVTGSSTTGQYTTTATQTAATSGTGRTIDFRHKLHKQKCKSVAFTFSNLGTFTSLAGITGFEALAIEVGVKKGPNRLSAAQTVA